MKKRITALLLCLVMALSLIPTTVWAANADAEGTDDGISVQANGTGHRISVKIYKVVLDSSKPLGYQNPELINTITVTCQDRTSHSGYNHSVNLKEFYPTNVGATTTDWSGWEFDSYYTKGNEKETFYNWTKGTVNATANVTGSEPYPCSKNFYLVYKDSTPTPPTKPTDNEVKTLLGNIVEVYCTVEQENNTNKLYGPYSLEDGTFTVGNVTGNATNGYTCTVTIDNVDNYTTKPTGHTTDDSKDAEMVKTITLTRSANATAWSVSNNGRFKLYAKCEQTPVEPEKPGGGDLEKITNAVIVDCTADNTHDTTSAVKGTAGTDYTISEVKNSTCTITINNVSAYYTTEHNKDTAQTDKVTVELVYVKDAWTLAANGAAHLYVKCEQAPAKPTDLTAVRGVRVNCVAKKQAPATHSGMDFCFLAGTYTVSDVARDANDAWYVTVTVTAPGKYVSSYDGMLGIMTGAAFVHDMYPANQQPTVKLVYDKQSKSWNAVDAGTETVQYATINVICRPALPTIPELNQLGVDVNVSCATKDSKHTGKTYTLNTNKDVVTGTITMNSQGQYECVLKLRDDTAKAYVTDYSGTTNADKKTHTLKDNGSVTLVWGDNGWELKDQNAKTLIISATCTTGGGTNPGTKPGTNPGAKNPYVKDEGKKVESGKTFDAGIALYVGLGILSLTGSAAAIYKRREEY